MVGRSDYILLADDDLEDQSLLKNVLLELDKSKRVESVFDGGAVIDYLNRCSDPDLPCAIVLDFKMPVMNADDVLATLGANLRYRAIPKIVWSTSNQQQHIDQCLKRGAKAYFTKPNSFKELETIATRMLKFCNDEA